jgi:hypothetical protein
VQFEKSTAARIFFIPHTTPEATFWKSRNPAHIRSEKRHHLPVDLGVFPLPAGWRSHLDYLPKGIAEKAALVNAESKA